MMRRLETINFALAGAVSNLEEVLQALEELGADDRPQLQRFEQLLKTAYEATMQLTGQVDALSG